MTPAIHPVVQPVPGQTVLRGKIAQRQTAGAIALNPAGNLRRCVGSVSRQIILHSTTLPEPQPACIECSPHTAYSQIASEIAEKSSITKKQAVEILEHIAALAYKHAKDSFTIPGLGKLVLVNRKARVGRNPATGETIQIKAKKVVKFRVAKAAKDAILGVKK